jgi:hypothetical protein
MLITLARDINERKSSLNKYRNYYLGKHRVKFVGAELQQDFGRQLQSLSCNRCETVVDAVIDRLTVTGFEDDDGDTNHEGIAQTFWKTANLDKIAREVHQEALVHGDAYVLVWPNEGVEVFSQHSNQMAVAYDDERPDQIYCAAKSWKVRTGHWRMNLYFNDRVEKYITNKPSDELPENNEQWTEHQDKNDSSWPVIHNFGRVPVFHFAVNARSGEYGRSDLAAIIPLQDRLNQTLANQAVAEEFQSYKQRWATGIQPMEIENEDGTREFVHPFEEGGADRLWTSTNDNTKFGEFSSADLNMFEHVVEGEEIRIARTARIPLHYIIQTGTPPSGESLKTAEAPFVAKVKDRQRSFGSTWNQLIRFVLFLQDGTQTTLRTVWASPETRMDHQLIEQAILKKELGISKAQILRELNYSEAMIEEFRNELELEADAMVSAFNES